MFYPRPRSTVQRNLRESSTQKATQYSAAASAKRGEQASVASGTNARRLRRMQSVETRQRIKLEGTPNSRNPAVDQSAIEA